MNNLKQQLSNIFLIVLIQMGFIHLNCFADLSFQLNDSFNFSKTTTTVEHLDRGNYRGTQVTSGWNSSKEVTSYIISPRVIWTINSLNTYVLVSGNYGWVLDGKSIAYPLRWDVKGNTKGCGIEVGYMWNVYKLFNFLPCIGVDYDVYNSRITNQRLFQSTIGSFVSQNGNKTETSLYFPYIGFEIDFTSKFCNKYDVQFIFNYNFGYGGGHGRTHVNRTIITDIPSTSRYGSHLKYQDIVSHDFGCAIAYSPTKKWTIGLELDYSTYYNTHKLPLRLDHNRALVAAEQYTSSQYHVVSDVINRNYSIILAVVYAFSGEGVFIAR